LGHASKTQSSMPAATLARRRSLLQRRQKFMAAIKSHAPAKLQGAQPQASSESTGVSFPGFLQADVLTPGNGPDDKTSNTAMLTADVNKDGKPDIINLQVDGTVNVLLNPGADKLSTMQVSSVNTSAGSNRQVKYAATADLNGDGYPELLTLDYYSSSVLIYPNLKDGTFGPATALTMKFSSGSGLLNLGGGGIALGDFDGDGIVDLAGYVLTPGYSSSNAGETSFELLVFPGRGDGSFKAPLPEQFRLMNSYGATMPGQATVGDINHDGKLDIVYMSGGFDANGYQETYVTALLGDGTGVFTYPTVELPKSGAIAVGIADGAIVGGIKLADFDGDGNLDVIFANCEDRNVYFSRGNGDGTFANSTTPITNLGYPMALSYADVNGDGKIDVIAYADGYTTVYPGLGNGAFAQPVIQFASSIAGYVPGEPADFDGDGQLDIARTDAATDYTSVYLEKKGTFNASPVLSPGGKTPSFIQVVASGDFNGDGVPDVLALDYTAFWSGTQRHTPYPDLVIGLNDGKGNFTYQVAIDHEALNTMGAGDAESGLVQPIVGDFNGDNLPDILLNSDQYGGLFLALSTGPGTFATPTQIAISQTTNCAFSRIDIGDLNGDGKSDIVLAYPGDAACGSSGSTPSGVVSLLGNGDGTFATRFAPIASQAYMPKLIDFNGDGKLDLALSDVNSNEFAFDFFIIPGNGDGTFNVAAATQPLLSGTAVTSIIPGDFNGDGKQDLTVGTLFREDSPFHFLPGTTGIETLAGKGDFTFGDPQLYAFGGYPYDGKYADFNGDGKPDLAMNIGYDLFQQSPILSNFGYLINQGDGTFGSFQPSVSTVYDLGGFFYPGDYNFYGSLLVADFNGDGASDALSVLSYDETYHYASQLFLNSGAISFTLDANAATVDQNSPVTVTANLKPTVGTKTPSGSVSFFDNGTLVSKAEVSANTASYTDSNPAIGVHNFTASYTGDSNFNAASASASVRVTVNALPPTFTMAKPSLASLNVLAGGSGTLKLTVNSNATFQGNIALSCSGAPSLATCTITPATLSLAGNQTGTATVTISTQGSTVLKSAVEFLPNSLKGAVSLATLLVLMWPARARRLRKMWMVLLVGSIAALSFVTVGCGHSSTKQVPGTPLGASTLTITAISGPITETQTVTLNVQ